MKTSDLLWQDAQHQDLLQMIDELKHAPEAGIEILDRLSEYVAHHFSLEEKYMRESGFPRHKADIHMRAHRLFADKIETMHQSRSILAEGLKHDEFRQEISEFLNGWLTAHVLGLDKELEAHVLKSSIK